ncbi:CGNR zinc finger domain-containing protein [Micromonospora taraxaci]|uniref:Putative stress-induced transcription regulator n=1 Tax=Micromonospora taraxaci TaxID=1316803 RepID=A0A561W3R6_9ACTN|nr:CGNR zinc finger domain-containing protein [Micromonospora taraxaci]TWG18514.1 putative stress-induced transcription regulator [Micromonospora taraxaci]
MDDDAAVPAAARLIRDFVNTVEPQIDHETLTSPGLLRDWFAERHLMPADAHLGPTDLDLATTIREGLRAVLLGHAGHESDPGALDRLNQALAGMPIALRFADDGHRLVDAASTPLGQAVAGLVDAIRQSAEDGTWQRLKVCARDTCRWAYYDSSRNQTRRWCSMAGCGNYVKMKRAYAVRTGRRPSAQPRRPDAP